MTNKVGNCISNHQPETLSLLLSEATWKTNKFLSKQEPTMRERQKLYNLPRTNNMASTPY